MAVLREQLLAAMAKFPAIVNVPVIRAQQPTLTGAKNGPALYLTVLARRRYGWAQTKDTANLAPGFTTINTQNIELTVQVQASVPIFTDQPPSPFTAGDLLETACLFLDQPSTIQVMLSRGVSMLRLSDVRPLYFKNEAGQNEQAPAIDLALKFATQINEQTPQITPPVEGAIKGF